MELLMLTSIKVPKSTSTKSRDEDKMYNLSREERLVKKQLVRLWRSALPLLPNPTNVHICVLLSGGNTYMSMEYGCMPEIAFYRITDRFKGALVHGARCLVANCVLNAKPSTELQMEVGVFNVPASWVKRSNL
jgi:hypothetical protein